MDNINNISSNMVKYIVEKDDNSAFASLNLNPAVRWAKFVLTDDKPNSNKVRVPISEFDNIIKTGVFMPIKVAEGGNPEGHEDAIPIGVITHLQIVKDKIEGLAALWQRERPEDVDKLKKRYDEGKPLDLSWEIMYSDSVTDEDTGIQSLIDAKLRAVTLVGIPAYAGRTSITAFASKDGNNQQEDSIVDELEKLKVEKETLETKIETLEEQIKTLNEQVAEASKDKDELEELRKFKKEIDELKARAEKISKIKEKFTEAGLEKSEEYFTEKMEEFLNMEEQSLDFMIQELVAFSEELKDGSGNEDEEDDENSSQLPRISATGNKKYDIKTLAKLLREENKNSKVSE
jgi:hypothetical protein